MDQVSLLHILEWIVRHGGDTFDAQRVRADTGIEIPPTVTSAQSVIGYILNQAASSAVDSVGTNSAADPDDFFDLLLSFFENLNAYHPAFVEISQDLSPLSRLYMYASLVHPITKILFAPHLKTHLDHITYDAIFIKLCDTWLQDTPPNLPLSSDFINRLVRKFDVKY